ncbi:MAG: thymidylate synthase [Hyphomicrobium sp.]
MHIKGATLDDLLRRVFDKALKSQVRTRSSKGDARELMAVTLTLENPRARFSRTERRATLLTCLGETLWYFSGSKQLDVIEHYIPSYRSFSELSRRAKTAPGAYGPRIFGGGDRSQLAGVIEHLRKKKDTRQAVIQIFDRKDLGKKDVPCTCTLQFMARGGRLHMVTAMRSNDAYRGLPHDVFAFTWLQEIVARSIAHEVGVYHHTVGSLHLYDDDEGRAREFLAEGWQETMAMPPLPSGDPWPSVNWLLGIEASIRMGGSPSLDENGVDPYWVDLGRLLRIHTLLKTKNMREIVKEKNAMTSPVYDAFIRSKASVTEAIPDAPMLNLAGGAHEQKGRGG